MVMTEELKNTEAATPETPAEGIVEDAANVAAEPEVDTTAAPKKKKRRKWPIILGVVVVVLIAAGAGFWVWHEQPSFCNAICHTPMDPYLPTYEATPGEAAVDKWGNEVTDASAMMAALHRAEDGDTCMSCHVPVLSEQIGEAMGWVSGNYVLVENPNSTDPMYANVLQERTLEELVAARELPEGEEFCLNENCHNITRDDLVELTSEYAPRNPHLAQHGEKECSDCHKAHRASVNWCSSCHSDAPIPEGWLTVAQANKLAV